MLLVATLFDILFFLAVLLPFPLLDDRGADVLDILGDFDVSATSGAAGAAGTAGASGAAGTAGAAGAASAKDRSRFWRC